MRFTRLTLFSAVLGTLFSGSMAFGQELITHKSLSLDVAMAIGQGALEKCRADGYRVTVTIVDASGTIKLQMHDDGAGPHTKDFSRRKAFSAFTFKRTTDATGKAWIAAPPAPLIQDAVGTAGGVPIKAGNEFIGGIGVSGAPGGDKDEICANAGIAKVASKLQ